VHVRIGIANATKELDVDVDDPAAIVAAYEQALKDDDVMLTIEERGGARTIVAVGAILYFAMEAADRPGIGFATGSG
jgi:hypothetical protein